MKNEDALLKIIIADANLLMRMGVKVMLIENFHNIEIYEASNSEEVYELTNTHTPHIILMDLPFRDSQGLLPSLLMLNPKLNILIFSEDKEEIYGKIYLGMGASGYLQKNLSPKYLLLAIQCVQNGNIYIRREMMSYYLGAVPLGTATSIYSALSKRETEILYFIDRGDSGTSIAKMMTINTTTVATHKARIFKKLNVTNICELKEKTALHPFRH